MAPGRAGTPSGSAAGSPRPGRGGTLCHLIAGNFVGGPEKQILELSRQLAARGWRVLIGSFQENRPRVPMVEEAGRRGFETFVLRTRSPFSPAAAAQLRRVLQACGADVLLTHGYKPDFVGYFATRRGGPTQVPIVRGYTAEDWKVRLYEAADRRLLRRFSRVLCVSRATGALMANYGLRRERLRVVHNSVHPVAGIAPVDLAQEFHLEPGARVLVAAGRLSPEKGHADLVTACALLRHSRPDLHTILLGAGREEANLRRQVRVSGLETRVHFAGFRPEVPRYLAAADLVVNPSHTEGLPNVLLEALSVGAAVVATDVGGTRELILPDVTGWLVPPANPPALAGAIEHALEHPEEARALADQGRRLVRESFNFSRQAEELLSLLAELGIQAKGDPAGNRP